MDKKPKNYWKDKINVIEESKKFKTRTEFKKKSQCAYNSAILNSWIDECKWLDNEKRHPKGYWKIRENIINESKKYATKEEFQEKNLTAFLAAYKYGYIDEMDWLVKQKQHKNGYWNNYENIEKEAIKYNTKTDFFKGNQTAYRTALKLGIIDDFFMNNYIEYSN